MPKSPEIEHFGPCRDTNNHRGHGGAGPETVAAVVGVKCCALSSHRIRDPAMHRGGGGWGRAGFTRPGKWRPPGRGAARRGWMAPPALVLQGLTQRRLASGLGERTDPRSLTRTGFFPCENRGARIFECSSAWQNAVWFGGTGFFPCENRGARIFECSSAWQNAVWFGGTGFFPCENRGARIFECSGASRSNDAASARRARRDCSLHSDTHLTVL